MGFPGHGPGYRFHPTDVELTMYYLKKKVMKKQFFHDGIQERDVYNLDPRDLKGQEDWKGDLKWYFFCPRERKYSTGKRTNRSTELGFWKTTGNDRSVYFEGKIVGMIKSLIFHEKNSKQRTDWVMHEYKLQDEYLRQLGWEEDEFVLCVVFEKEGPGPRNGAQYGAPFREEDWDDVNEEPNNCEENAQGVGAMLQVHDPTDKVKSTVLTESNWAGRYCVGSSSRTFPSDIDQSVNYVFPPTPVLRTLPVDAQLPLTDEGGISFHEIPSISLGHEQGLKIGVDQGVSSELAIPDIEKNVYGDLVDLFSLDDICDSGVNACDNDSLANQNTLPDDFMEVDDCQDGSDSFEGLHDPAGPKQPTSFGAVIPDGILNPTFVGQNNWSVGVSETTPSWNRHHREPAPTDLFINGTLTMGFSGPSCGGYETLLEHNQFSDGLCFQDFGDDVLTFNQDNRLNAGPLGFGDRGFGENLLDMSPNLQFSQAADGFISHRSGENVPPLHDPQFAEGSAWRGPGSVQNVQYLNQHPQTADGSTWLHGQESIMNGQTDRGFAGNGAAASFGNVLPPQSVPRGSPRDPS